jgi:hypothetical protein
MGIVIINVSPCTALGTQSTGGDDESQVEAARDSRLAGFFIRLPAFISAQSLNYLTGNPTNVSGAEASR